MSIVYYTAQGWGQVVNTAQGKALPLLPTQWQMNNVRFK